MDRIRAIEAEEKGLSDFKENMGNRQRKVGVSTFFSSPKIVADLANQNTEDLLDASNCGDCKGEIQMIEDGPLDRCFDLCPLRDEPYSSNPEVSIHRPTQRNQTRVSEGWNPYADNTKEEPCSAPTGDDRPFLSFCKNGFDCRRCSKPEVLNWIGQHVSQVYNNTRVVRQKINSVFDELIQTCEERRGQLLNEVTDIEGKKIESLKRVHDACMSSEKLDNQFIENFCSLDFVGNFRVDDSHPWPKMFPLREHQARPSSDKRKSSLPSINSLPEFQDKLDLMTFQFPTVEEGNLVFQEEQSLSSKILSFGKLNETLASPDFTTVSGLGLMYGFVDEESMFEVNSRSKTGEVSVLNSEILKVRIIGPGGVELDCYTNGSAVTFKPAAAGDHTIHVLINGVEIPGSPATCRVLEKASLVFDIQAPSKLLTIEKEDEVSNKRIVSGSKRELRSADKGDDNGNSNEEQREETSEPSTTSPTWTLQRGETSALLSKTGDGGALLYASQGFSSGSHAWKIKVTSACLSVDLFIGVSTRTENFDLDTDIACNFSLSSPPLKRTSQTFFSPQRRRKVSIFERYTVSFIVIADLAFRELKVINSSTLEIKLKSIPLSYTMIYPTIFMAHECKKSVCPRPQVTFS